ALAQKGCPVVCITGDGSMLMNGQEITVAIQEELPVIFVVLNDNGYGMVKHGQRMTGAEEIGVEIPKTNFASFARAMGAQGYVIHSPEDLLALDVNEICNRNGPTLLDVRIDPDEIPPIGVRTQLLAQNS
ncbi:MAG: thiamine pyrophosphate-binding protein, partial [Porticoccus sp.]|nr:thiamine pyrophosphate-binding protein [Porticoccus sp.]